MTRLPLPALLALWLAATCVLLLGGCQQVTCYSGADCSGIVMERGRNSPPVLNPDITNEGDVSGLPGLGL